MKNNNVDSFRSMSHDRTLELELRVAQLEEENRLLREQLQQQQQNTKKHVDDCNDEDYKILLPAAVTKESKSDCEISCERPSFLSQLSAEQIERYCRPILAGLGVKGQIKLLQSSVLVVGAGGIGSSCLLYLAGAGVGCLGIVDFDTVQVTNLHRQVIHTTHSVGMPKAVSAQRAVLALNPSASCKTHVTMLTHDNALTLFQDYDVIVDASDNPKTRYLINDACVFANKPLVFSSAVGTEAQLTVYNYQGSGCYRCLYPKPAASTSCASCADAGVVGPVPGLMGVLQAMEVIKIVTGWGQVLSDRLLQYDALSCRFLSIKKPSSSSSSSSSVSCPICSKDHATIRSMMDSERNLEQARGPVSTSPCALSSTSTSSSIDPGLKLSQISCREYHGLLVNTTTTTTTTTTTANSGNGTDPLPSGPTRSPFAHVLLDVRVPLQFDLFHLPGAVNIPLEELESRVDEVIQLATGNNKTTASTWDCSNDVDVLNNGVFSSCKENQDEEEQLEEASSAESCLPVYCICRRGIASKSATELLTKILPSNIRCYNIIGGMNAWHEQVDPTVPMY